jgi:hypothetical protein
MAIPAPARTGFRISASEEAPAIYAHPPLVESWLSVEFAPAGEPFTTNASAVRTVLGPEWTGTWREVPGPTPSGSLQLTNVMGDRALRLTPVGFAFGWLGYSGERYPRYESVRDGFVAVLDKIRELTGKAGVELIPHRWSVRYANRIPQGTVWSTPDDWGFFGLWQPLPLKGLGIEPAGIHSQWELPLEAERGSLTVEFRHDQTQSSDAGECLWINLMTAGIVEDAETGLFDCFDYGREVIVRAFNELVSPAAKSYWGVSARVR